MYTRRNGLIRHVYIRNSIQFAGQFEGYLVGGAANGCDCRYLRGSTVCYKLP
jgi:hypothetical protein